VHVGVAPAWVTLKTCPPMVSEALREVVLVLAVAE
jgi:hypothetical protein